MGFSLPEVWLDEVETAPLIDRLIAHNTCAIRLALGNGSAFDLYVAFHGAGDEEPRILVIAPEGSPPAVIELDRGPVCMPKRFARLPDTDAMGLAFFATMLRYQWQYDRGDMVKPWLDYVQGEEFQDALHDMGLPHWTQYERRPGGVPEWTAERRPPMEGTDRE